MVHALHASHELPGRRPRQRGPAADELEPPSTGASSPHPGAACEAPFSSPGLCEVGAVVRTGGAAPVRVLVAEGRGAPEARIELRAGVLTGASIHVRVDGAGIQLRVSAPTQAAQVALAAAIDRARLHLRTRGIVVGAERVVQTGTTEGRGRADRDRAR